LPPRRCRRCHDAIIDCRHYFRHFRRWL
jgi:hypothetical protein